MLLSDLIAAMESIAPTKYAEPWDNVGLLVGDPTQPITKILLTIDYTQAVAEEARGEQCDTIISYHPPIFDPIKRLTAPSLIFDAIRRGVAIYSPHTAYDVADGGVNDFLADILGLINRTPLKLAQSKSTQYKLVTFVPEDHADRVSSALFAAGAGKIGAYSSCSFRSPGTGTFFGDESTNPAVGQKRKLEQQPEIRIETVAPITQIESVIRALRESHPYEEPAFDLNQLAAAPEGIGIGRVGSLAPIERQTLFTKIKSALNLTHLLISGPTTGQITRAARRAGAGGSLLSEAIREKSDLYLTGELRHHDALAAARAGMTAVCALHSNSERAALSRLKEQLGKMTPVPILISREDRDPFTIA